MLKKVFTTLAILACVGVFLLVSSPSVSADTYYGNGLYCGKHYCHVNWEILAICRSYCSKWGA